MLEGEKEVKGKAMIVPRFDGGGSLLKIQWRTFPEARTSERVQGRQNPEPGEKLGRKEGRSRYGTPEA